MVRVVCEQSGVVCMESLPKNSHSIFRNDKKTLSLKIILCAESFIQDKADSKCGIGGTFLEYVNAGHSLIRSKCELWAYLLFPCFTECQSIQSRCII
jgi:hypothetical protein